MTAREEIEAILEEERIAEQAWRDFELGPNASDSEWRQKSALEKKWKDIQAKRKRLQKPVLSAQKLLERVRRSIKQAEDASRSPEGPVPAALKAIENFKKEEQKILSRLSDLGYGEAGTPVAPAGQSVVPVSTTTVPTGPTGPARTTPTGAAQFRMAEMASRRVPGVETTTGPATTVTTGGGGGGGAGGGGGRTPRTRIPKNWEAQFRRMFPEQSWLLDLDRSKYPSLFKLIQRGVADRMYETPEGQARFASELRSTDFYVELRNTNKVRDIKALVGDLGFDTVPFNKFLATASNMNWQDETLRQEVYKEAFRKNDAGQYVNPTAVTRVRASNNYLEIANIGKAYFSQVADSTIENALTGGIAKQDVERQQRELAKTKYSHLGNLIEQGFTLEELSQPFKQQAAALLEKSPDAIDMSQAQFEAAYNFGEPGKKRMMTSGEWEIMLRSDAKYGWDRTENAKREARQLATSIAQAFGKVI